MCHVLSWPGTPSRADGVMHNVYEIDEQHYVDAGLDYEFGDHVSASLGINNVFDNDPPRTEQQFNTDTGFYDVFGRSYTLRLSVQY